MPDQFEYFDEHGKPIDPADLDGSEYEIIDEPVTTPQPEPEQPTLLNVVRPARASPDPDPGPRLSKGAIVGVLAVALVLGGGAAFALSQIGNENNATSVADVRSKVESKRDDIVADARPDVNACDGTQIKDAAWTRNSDEPSKQLNVVDSLPLPPEFVKRSATSDDPADTTAMVQFGDRSLGIYNYDAKADKKVEKADRWWKVSVTTAPELAVTGEEKGTGRDVDAATACTSVPGGVYRVIGDGIPAAAREMQSDLVDVAVLKGDGVEPATVWAVAGDRLLKATLQYTASEDE
nr:hypothetical protein [uncultured Rhodococcus sp.]